MVRYNINAMPVLEEGRVAGLINRQVVEKAIYTACGTKRWPTT